MNPYIEKLKTYFAQFPQARDSIGTVMEVLCHYYTVENPIENAVIQAEFLDMEPILEKLSLEDNNALFGTCIRLCTAYADRAFAAGLRAGAQLFTELYEPASANTEQQKG